jgi:hypothetical protein
MTVRYHIAAVEARRQHAEALADQIPGAIIHYDVPPSGSSWPNYRAALLDERNAGADWILSVDDDAELAVGFTGAVERALTVCPGDFANFFTRAVWPLTNPRRTHPEVGPSWYAYPAAVWGICWAIRADRATECVQVAERLIRDQTFHSGDCRLLAYLKHTNTENWIAMPNLVQHRADLHAVLVPEMGSNDGRLSTHFIPDATRVTYTARTWNDSRR